MFIIALVSLALAILYPAFFLREPSDATKYDFEVNTTGWQEQDWPGHGAFSKVRHSDEQYHEGKGSLAVTVHLIGGDSQLDRGEVYVNMLRNPPPGISAPLNLHNVQVLAWVYIPKEAVMGDRVGGLQLFAKDHRWKNYYGHYVDLRNRVGYWFVVTMVTGIEPSDSGASVDPGFDPSQVIAIGLRLDACGTRVAFMTGNSSSTQCPGDSSRRSNNSHHIGGAA